MARLWGTFVAIFQKELLRVRRTRHYLFTLVVAQLMNVLSLAWIDVSIRDLPIVLVDNDHSAESRELVQRVTATNTFRIAYETSSVEQARSHVRAGRAKAALVIPPDFGRHSAARSDAQILVLVDGSDASVSEQATQALDRLALEMNARATEEIVPAIEARSFILFNPSARNALFMLPGLLALLLSEQYAHRCFTLVIEREDESLERLLMTPMSHTGLILGLMAPHVIYAFVNGIVYLLLMRFGFDVPVRGAAPWLVAGIACYSVCVVALGAFVAAGSKTYDQAFTVLVVRAAPSMLLSGYVFPLSCVPKALLPFSYALPETHLIEIMRGMCLRGATVSELAPHFAYLLVASVLLTVGAIRRFSRSVLT